MKINAALKKEMSDLNQRLGELRIAIKRELAVQPEEKEGMERSEVRMLDEYDLQLRVLATATLDIQDRLNRAMSSFECGDWPSPTTDPQREPSWGGLPFPENK